MTVLFFGVYVPKFMKFRDRGLFVVSNAIVYHVSFPRYSSIKIAF